MKSKKFALFQSVISLILCISMLMGTTFAWFTDSVETGLNTIAAGVLDVELYHSNAAVTDERVTSDTELFKDLNGNPILWEPGAVSFENLRVANAGDLALVYRMTMATANENFVKETDGSLHGLSEALKVGIVDGGITATDRAGVVASVDASSWTTLSAFLRSGSLLPEGKGESEKTWGIVIYWEPGEYDNLWNLNNGKVLNEGEFLTIDLGISLIATQEEFESDSFGKDYDTDAEAELFPGFQGGSVSAPVVPDDNGLTSADVSLTAEQVSAFVPQGVKLADGAAQLTLTVVELPGTASNIQLGENEAMRSLDVHIDGVATDNAQPITVTLAQAAPTGLNMGNYKLYHVENGATVEMTYVDASADFTAHNQFKYDPVTGDIQLYMATFSEVAVVAEEPRWEGNFDYSWYTNAVTPVEGEAVTEYRIANADQLAGLSAIVGGMNGQTRDSFAGKTVKLISDINLGDKESENNPDIIFYPIGYNSDDGKYEKTGVAVSTGFYSFMGTFDGNGHTVSNFYQNTWEMKGDHNWYSPEEQYYRDGMGLFGKVYGGTVKNLTVKNFSSDGEIATTGVIAAYADGATFENIAIFDCNPRVYNIGNGGIVGCVGWYAKEADLKTTFTNITVDNSNKISALWGSYDVACGGIVGQYYPTSGQSSVNYPVNAGIHFENCHVSAVMDVYNDVCANYQYYAYRYTGMLIGSVRENETIDGHVYPKMDGITASGCTVHFGDWNDYYYCELVANSLASYTHDHQMSRLTQVASVNVEKMKVTSLKGETTDIPTSGRVNYVVVKAKDANGMWIHGDGHDYAECYHFVNGVQHFHNVADADNPNPTETVNGVEGVLKEDKQLVYLEFNNLVTGYGWGVTSKGVNDLDGVTILDESLDGSSYTKFEKATTVNDSYMTTTTVTIGDLFAAAKLEGKNLAILNPSVSVAVSPVGETSTAGGIYEANTTDWTKGTLTFTGTGAATITITDYYFCTPTTIEVTITDRQDEVKFEKLFTNEQFTYRVGNQNAVKLGSLFKAKDDVTIGTVSVTIEALNGTAASGTYTSNATWMNGAIQFSGTGVVKVSITDNDYCIPTELTLEVVDAVNATTATNATSNNVVLLNDCGFSSLTVSDGYALYGNGFTMTCGSDSVALDMGYSFVTLNNGTLDNVQIVCPNFDYAALYKSNLTSSDNRSETDANGKTRYYNAKSGVMVSGNSQILNSRISGARAAVNVSGGNVLIDNSRIELGAVASILVGSANSLTLRDVTLVQKPTASTYDSSKTLMGFSVLVVCDANGDSTPITLEGKLVQNAWANASHKKYVPSSGQDIVEGALKETAFLHDIDGDGTNESLNLGFAYMPESAGGLVNPTTISDNDHRTNKEQVPYESVQVSLGLDAINTYVYSYKNSAGTDAEIKNEHTYTPDAYGDIITVTYNDTSDGLIADKSFGADGWTNELNVDLDKLSGYMLDFSKLSMMVNGVAVTDFKVDGNAKPTSPVAVIAGGTTYTLTATVNGKEYTATYKVTGTETSKDSPQWSSDANGAALSTAMNAKWEAGLCVASSYGGTWHGAAPALQGVYVRYWSVAESTYKIIHLAEVVTFNKGQLNGTNTTWTYTPDNGDFTLTLTGGQVHSSNNVYAMPVGVDADGDDLADTLYFVAATSNGLVNSGNSARTISVTYSFKDNNGGTELTGSYTWSVEENKNQQYSYSDFCKGKLTLLQNGGCVTPDTLVTLADGTQKRIDQVTYADQLLVWDFFNGAYTTVPAALVIDHGEGNYDVITLTFEDGTVVNAVEAHAFFSADENAFVMLDPQNAEGFVGDTFIKATDHGYEKVKLVEARVSQQYTGSYSIVSAYHYNFIVEDMFSLTNLVPGLIAGLEVGENMKYDEEKLSEDIAKYGLYTYADFADYVTEAQFNAFNGAYLKISAEKGYVTYEEIVNLITRFVNN